MSEVAPSMAIDAPDDTNSDIPKKALKRKRTPSLCNLAPDHKKAQIEALNLELEGLFRYYAEMMYQRDGLGLGLASSNLDSSAMEGNRVYGMVGMLMEESDLPLSKLVDEIYGILMKEKLTESLNLTLATVKSAVLLVGQRLMYGVPNVDADVLEDQTQACLWCWETRDIKLMPKFVRGSLKIRRLCRKKICERINAVSAMIAVLQKPEQDQDYKSNLRKSLEKLGKVLNEADIHLLVDSMLQKNGADMADKEVKREEKLLIKQLEKNKREAEKEKKRMEIELQKEKRQIEKEQKRLQEEAEKDEKRREKEEFEMRRQLRKQQEEAEKEQRRREREEAELKKQLSVRKQASIMERFLKRNKNNSPCRNDQTSNNTSTPDTSSKECEKMLGAITSSMDYALSSIDDRKIGDILRSHLSSWRHLGHSLRSNRKQHWSIRKKPKTELFKELKLTAIGDLAHDSELGMEKLVSEWGEQTSDDRSCHAIIENSSPGFKKCYRRKQLLQFDKSHRPAFFGIWPKKSLLVGPRHPFRKEPDLDYDVDSDEEWEEEEPGESLSNCDMDEEEEILEEGCSKADEEEESEDGFFVPDGYLSENEGVQVDRMEIDASVEEAKSLPVCKQDLESEEFCALLQHQKYLHNLTESALRKNQPLIILNLMHEKVSFLVGEDPTGNSKLERMCLQALSIRTFPGGPPIEVSADDIKAEEEDACPFNSKTSKTPTSMVAIIQDSEMPELVSAIRSCSQSINKVVDSLQLKFPSVSKTQLRNKVREISDFVDNHWQVKKEILDSVGMSSLPEKGAGSMHNISTFFSKRCLPPTGKSMNPNETSLQQMSRKSGSGSAMEEQQLRTFTHP